MCGAPSPRSGPYPPLLPERQDPSKTRWTTGRQKRPARPFANWVPCNRLYPELQEAEIEGTKRQKYALTIRTTGFKFTSLLSCPTATADSHFSVEKHVMWETCRALENFNSHSERAEPVILDMGCTPPKAAAARFVPESVAAMSRSGEIRGSALVQRAEPELSNHRLSRSVRFQRKSWKRPKA